MQNPKLDGVTWVSDTRASQTDTYTETHTTEGGEQTAEYKLIETHPIIGGVLDKLAFLRTHASAVWYNKLAGITVLQKLDNLASNIGTLASLLTTDKTSLVAAVNELNGKIGKIISSNYFYVKTVSTEAKTTIQFSSSAHGTAFCFGDCNNYPFAVVASLDSCAKLINRGEFSVDSTNKIITLNLDQWSLCTIISTYEVHPWVS